MPLPLVEGTTVQFKKYLPVTGAVNEEVVVEKMAVGPDWMTASKFMV
jgi:hypothetical protein